MPRLLTFGLALAVAALAAWMLLRSGAAPPPQGEIGDASRAALERVLREAEDEARP